ncbi:GNAT family N-acetyltransferase [Ornithinimicrobium tianjinense]|uniref:N-acetyltransferase n=1 Tax=Ornithinimicrobium tianjinense TaxID=1195761 RepID=A0A917F1M6_9MICO|nr:GNAT family N-acetyltransferase [Ornithinimicrobium tianjinense]GGF41471.1 N-acetyltransferase [Ornithinimicrobium tianjinense]
MSEATAYTVRTPQMEDVEGFAQLHVRVWQETYRGMMDDEALDAMTVESFRPMWYSVAKAYAQEAVPDDGRAIKLALLGEEPAGFAMAGPAREAEAPSERQLWSLNVAPEHQGSGIAQRLLEEVLGEGPAYLWVARGNARAIRFYERNGFALDGTSDLRPDGMTELRMVRA